MKKVLSLFLSVLLLQTTFCLLLMNRSSAQTMAATEQTPAKPITAFGLLDGTPVKMRTI